MDPSNNDCYFYYYSTCTKGKDCPFRHCELALGTETVCTLWRDGLCTRKNCMFRHMESRINRTTIRCYWENQPGGCRKPHCVFMHHRTRVNVNSVAETQKLILPVTSQLPNQTLPSSTEELSDMANNNMLGNDIGAGNSSPLHPTLQVAPVVVRLNDGEESDNESIASTVIKSSPAKGSTPSKHLNRSENDNLGIKTLEQLRMEKIHRESEHFYKSVYDAPSLENDPMKLKVENPLYPRELWGQKPVPEVQESYHMDHTLQAMGSDSLLDDNAASSDLRSVLKRKHVSSKPADPKLPVVEPRKRVISLKKIKGDLNSEPTSITVTLQKEPRKEESLDFQIKTLDEIRKEKNKPKRSPEHLSNGSEEAMEKVADVTVEPSKSDEKPDRNGCISKPRVKRPSQEIYSIKPSLSSGKSPKRGSPEDTGPDTKKRRLSVSLAKSPEKDQQSETTKENSQEPSKKMQLQGNPPTVMADPQTEKGVSFAASSKPDDKTEPSKKNYNMEGLRSFIRRHPLTRLGREENPYIIPGVHVPMNTSCNNLESSAALRTTRPKLRRSTETRMSPPSNIEEGSLDCKLQGQTIDPVSSPNCDFKLAAKETCTEEADSVKTEHLPSYSNVSELVTPPGVKLVGRSLSADDYDQLLLSDDADMPLDDEVQPGGNTEDILLELEEMLKS